MQETRDKRAGRQNTNPRPRQGCASRNVPPPSAGKPCGKRTGAGGTAPGERSLEDMLQDCRRFCRESGFSETVMRLRTVRFAAEILGCDASTVRRYVARGLLPAKRPGPRSILLDLADLAEFRSRGNAAFGKAEGNAAADTRISNPKSVGWAAGVLGCCRRTVLRHVHARRIRAVRYSRRRIMVEASDVLALLRHRGAGLRAEGDTCGADAERRTKEADCSE